MAEIVLGIMAHQLAFGASNGAHHFRSSLARLSPELSKCGHPSTICRNANIFWSSDSPLPNLRGIRYSIPRQSVRRIFTNGILRGTMLDNFN